MVAWFHVTLKFENISFFCPASTSSMDLPVLDLNKSDNKPWSRPVAPANVCAAGQMPRSWSSADGPGEFWIRFR